MVGRKSVSYILVLFSFVLLVSGCGSSDTDPSSGTGSIAFGVNWQGAPTLAPSSPELKTSNAAFMAAPLDCATSGVNTVSAIAYDSANNPIASGGPWSCSAHTGTVNNIPAGSNIKFTVLGKDSSGSVLYKGEQPGVTITASQTTNVGTITATIFAPTLMSPSNNSTSSGAGLSFSWTGTGSSYQIQVSNNTGFSTTTIDTTTTTANYTPTITLSAGTYYWRVKAIDSYGNASAWSSTFTLSTTGSATTTTTTPPSAPTGVSATAGNTQATISWSSVTGATSYNIYWATTPGFDKTTGTKITGVTSPYAHTGRTNGTGYYYFVTAVNSYGESIASGQVSAMLSGNGDTTQPTVLSTSPANSATGVVVNSTVTATFSEAMTASSISAATFRIEEGTTSVSGTVGYSGTTATFTPTANLLPSTIYTASIWGYDLAGNTVPGTYTWTFTTGAVSDTTAPSNTTAATFINSGASSTSSASVTLYISATDAVGVSAYYASETSTAPSATAAGWVAVTPATNYTNTNVFFNLSSGDGTKTVYIWFKDAAGNVSASASDSITLSTVSIPATPAGVSASAGNAQNTISWNAVSGATNYNIYYSTTPGVTTTPGNRILPVPPLTITSPYNHTGRTNGTTYYYIVTAVNAGGESIASSEVSATPVPPVPSAPTGVSATAGDTQNTISWTAVTGATSYNIYWSTTTGVTTSTGTKITGATSPYSHTGLTNGTTYYYIVTAVTLGGESAASSQVSAVIPALSAPTGVSATTGDAQNAISWSAVTGATSYNIYWSTTAGVTIANGTKITGATGPYNHTDLTNGTTYYYIVTAENIGGESVASAQVSAVIPTLSAPIGVSASAGDTQTTISWSAVTGATSYNIYYSITAGVTTSTGTKITGATSPYIHTGLTNGTTYYYIVTAVNAGGESLASSQASATPKPLLIQGGIINVDTTWNRTDVVYAITNNLLINQGVTLTVAPGVIVQFAAGTYLKVKGTISAVGTSASKIVFQNAHIVIDWTWSSENSWPLTYSPSSGTYVTGPRFEYCDLTGGLISSTCQTFYGMGAYIRNCTLTNAWNDSSWTGIKGAYIGTSAIDSLAGGGGLLSAVITNSYIKTVNIDGYSSGYSPGTIFDHNAIDTLTVDRWNTNLTLANNNIANVVLNRPSTSAQFSGGVVLNNNNFTTISGYTIKVQGMSDSSVKVNAQLNYWGPTTTAEMNAKGPSKLIDKIYDMYADFNLVEVDHSNYFGSTIVGAGPNW